LLEEKQNWISNGIAKIADLLRHSNDQEIFSKLIAAIVKYIQANQGCIYLLNEEDIHKKFLNLEACYAYERQKFMTKKIEIGQGLIGQCFLEKEYIILKEVPEEYIKITSGLGEAVPTFIVIVPIMEENRIDGVMEFALFHELEAYQIDFLTQLGSNISSFVSTSTLNIQTKKLLQQSQLQTEQLRAQEEEMRQNMEEMQATQEEMQRKEEGYLRKIKMFEEEQAI
jgi:methyl-accepting chemotaxis protein